VYDLHNNNNVTQGHLWSFKMTPLSRACISSISILLKLCLYLVPFLRYSEILVEHRDFFIVIPLHSTPPLRGGAIQRWSIAIMFSTAKTRMVWLPEGEKSLMIF